MQSLKSGEVTPAEWRWVIIVSGLLVTLTLIPYLIAFSMNKPTDDWRFMGLLYNPQDGVTYLAKIRAGMQGQWMYQIPFTPERQQGAYVFLYYLAVGHLARLFNLPALLAFHVVRLLGMLMMLLSFYHLGSVIWDRRRPRQLFFIILAVGSGLGWLYLLLFGHTEPLPTDITLYDSVPFFASLTTMHFPFIIGLLALQASFFIRIFRPGFNRPFTLIDGGAAVMLISLLLPILSPMAMVPLGLAICLYITLEMMLTRRLPRVHLTWVIFALVPVLPFSLYYVAVTYYDSAWNSQLVTLSPPLIYYLIGLGVPLLVALPGIIRTIRHWEQDGDRFMLLWLISYFILLYFPSGMQRRFSIGLTIPVVYFAVRSIEDFWQPKLSWPQRKLALITLMALIIPSNILSLFLPLVTITQPQQGLETGVMLSVNKAQALAWLDQSRFSRQVALMSEPLIGNMWIPATTPMRVVWGHPFETFNEPQKRAEMLDWYAGKACDTLVKKYSVSILIIEDNSSASQCVAQLGLTQPLQRFGNVAIYEVIK